MVLLLGALAAGTAFAQIVPLKPAFTPAHLQRYLASDTPREEKLRLRQELLKLRPTTPADVDLLYACVSSEDAGLESAGRERLCTIRDKALLEASRKHITPANLDQAEKWVREHYGLDEKPK